MNATDDLKKMTLEEAEALLSNEVYNGSHLLEELEFSHRACGNGHHARQAVAAFAVAELRARWLDEDEIALAKEKRPLKSDISGSAQRPVWPKPVLE